MRDPDPSARGPAAWDAPVLERAALGGPVVRACVGLGSNLGDRLASLRAARAALDADATIRVVAASGVYETDPVGPEGQGRYLNAVLRLETDRSPRALLERLLSIERELGRDRASEAARWGPRPIDLDLLLVDGTCIEEPDLHVPHPRLHERAFVLEPLAEVAADWVHPRIARSVVALRDALRPQAGVDRLTDVRPEDWVRSGSGGSR